MKGKNVIIRVEPDSIAMELEIEAGDILLDINGQEVKDVFDYRYLIQDEYIELGIEKPDGEQWLLEIEKDEFEDLGIIFEKGLMDQAKSCSNKCIFCFIDQLPRGMRKNLYFKDDDTRLSFLHGNYVTLTNMKEEDLDRIIFYHLLPINISVHATNPELRVFMLKNPNASNLMARLKKLYDNKIEMNFQIVLCKDINDGNELERSLRELSEFVPIAKSLSVVPFGMTMFRDGLGLPEIELFNKEECLEVIKTVEKWQNKLLEEKGTRFCFASDEFYLKAELPLPADEEYEGYPQLENGVGMLRNMREEFDIAFKELKPDNIKRNLSIVTGKSSFNFISSICCDIMNKYPCTNIKVLMIENKYFGETITVSGLLTGTDIIEQLKDKTNELGKYLLIPENAVRDGEGAFLDDITIKDLEKELDIKVVISPSEGGKFAECILDLED